MILSILFGLYFELHRYYVPKDLVDVIRVAIYPFYKLEEDKNQNTKLILFIRSACKHLWSYTEVCLRDV